jgi:hypothetical protein
VRWSFATIAGKTCDLSHLDPFEFEFVIPEKDGKPAQLYRINVEFSLHCFTRGIRAGESYAADMTYSDSRETRLSSV